MVRTRKKRSRRNYVKASHLNDGTVQTQVGNDGMSQPEVEGDGMSQPQDRGDELSQAQVGGDGMSQPQVGDDGISQPQVGSSHFEEDASQLEAAAETSGSKRRSSHFEEDSSQSEAAAEISGSKRRSSHFEEDASQSKAATKTSGSKRRRGPNKLSRLHQQQERIVVELNEYQQPIGNSEVDLAHYCGQIARDSTKTPINYNDWRKIPKEVREQMVKTVLSKFEWDTSKGRKWIVSKINDQLRNWKNLLKKTYYDPEVSLTEQYKHHDERVDPQQWKELVNYWRTPEAVESSTRNQSNRRKQKMPHTAGTKSFARIREEERAKDPNKQAPDRIEMFRITRTRGGDFVDAPSEVAWRKMDQRLNQQCSEGSESSIARDAIFMQVMGEDKRGRVRTFGFGVNPSDFCDEGGSRLSEALREVETERAMRIECQQRMGVMVREMQDLKESTNQMQQQFMAMFQSFENRLGRMIQSGQICNASNEDTQLIEDMKWVDS